MKTHSALSTLGILGIAFTISSGGLRGDEKKPPAKPDMADFLRFVEDEDAGRLQTSIATYRNKEGAEVHVVAAVHIGDSEYYADLNRVFAGYDALLFEMVGGRDGLKEEDLKGTGGLRMLQGMMGKTLNLDFQLEEIDYTSKNFVHADMDAATFARRIKKQGLNLFALMNKVSKWERERALERKKKGIPEPEMGGLALIQALVFGGGEELKLNLGRQFGDLNGFLAEMEDEGSVIIGERNAVALKVLEKTLEKGSTNVGIFYGAAHLPDMELKLAEMGFRRVALDWKTAWFIPKKDEAKRDDGADGAEDVEKREEGKEAAPAPRESKEPQKDGGARKKQGRHRKLRPAA